MRDMDLAAVEMEGAKCLRCHENEYVCGRGQGSASEGSEDEVELASVARHRSAAAAVFDDER